jgi:dystonin
VNIELEAQIREHNLIEQFNTQVEQCITAKSNFGGEELILYTQQLVVLQKMYIELRTISAKRLHDLEVLQDFLQSATNELMWLQEKEEAEIKRDWSDKNLDLASIETYYEVRFWFFAS